MDGVELNMTVRIPDEIVADFLLELERDGFVFATLRKHTLILSKSEESK